MEIIIMKTKNKYFYNSLSKCIQRKVDTRNIRKILIVCEGTKTEPNYFRSFPKHNEVDVVVEGSGMVADSLVGRAIELKDRAEDRDEKYYKVWCVFDRDSNQKQNFNRALQLGESNQIYVAYSIEAFELWYLLHFEFLNSGISRAKYCEKIDRHIGKNLAVWIRF